MQVHCENADGLVDAATRVFEAGFTGPEGHYIARPAAFEVLKRSRPPSGIESAQSARESNMQAAQGLRHLSAGQRIDNR
jgi:hypothetical protein